VTVQRYFHAVTMEEIGGLDHHQMRQKKGWSRPLAFPGAYRLATDRTLPTIRNIDKRRLKALDLPLRLLERLLLEACLQVQRYFHPVSTPILGGVGRVAPRRDGVPFVVRNLATGRHGFWRPARCHSFSIEATTDAE
jgi:hypothetical protein